MANPKITIKEAKLIKGIAEGKTKRQAAMEAYDTKSLEVAGTVASEALRKPNVQEALQIALEKHGITLDAALAPISKALQATKVQITGLGDQAFAELVEDVDLQLKGSDRALKLMGISQPEGGITNFNFLNISKEDKNAFNL